MNSLLNKLFDSDKNHGLTLILLRGTFSSLLIKVFGALLSFFIQVILARMLGVENFGYYVYAMVWLNLIVLFSKLGTDTSLVRFLPEYASKRDWRHFKGLLIRSFQGVFLMSLLLGVLASVIVWGLHDKIEQDQAWTLWISFLFVPVLALSGLRQAALRGLKLIVYAEAPERIIRPVSFAVFLGAAYFLGVADLGSPGAMILNGLSLLVAFCFGTFLLRKSLSLEARSALPLFDMKQWLQVSLPLFLIAGMHLLLKRTDIIMVGALTDASSTGIYAASVRVSDLVVFALVSVNSIAAPMISELYHSNRVRDLQNIVTQSSRVIFMFCVIVTVVLLVGGKFILGLFGEEFTSGYLVLVILLAGQLVNAFVGSVGYLMSMTGHQKQAFIIVMLSALLNILLNAVLIPLYGMLGAALATAISMACWNLAMLFFVKRRLNLDPTVFGSFS